MQGAIRQVWRRQQRYGKRPVVVAPGFSLAHLFALVALAQGYNVCALKVSHACTEPVLMPVVNQRTRWALEPWVKLSGTT